VAVSADEVREQTADGAVHDQERCPAAVHRFA
jgi:hypothetical protein